MAMPTKAWLCTACLAACSIASAVSTSHAAASSTEGPAIDIHRPAAAFSRPSATEVSTPAVLQAYLRTKDEVHGSRHARRANRFCFVKQAPRTGVQGDTANVWMIWHEGREILNTAGRVATGDEAEFLGRSEALAKSVHLATDVVESEEQIAGSTFLVDRAWVDRIVGACRKTGRTVTVAPRRQSKH